MKKRVNAGILIVIFLILISLSLVFSSSENQKVQGKIYEKFEKSEKIRVIASFENETGIIESLGKLFTIEESNRQKIEAILGKSEIKQDFGDSISILISKEDLEKLEASPKIKKIDYDEPVSAFLSDSAPLINATASWSSVISGINLTGIGETICIIDSGINYSNDDLGGCYGNNNASSSCKVLGGIDYVNGDDDPLDDNGHGTHVAGIAAASGSVAGIAPGAKLIAIKALDSGGGGYGSDIKAGIDWCTSNASIFNISVISMSLGSIENYISYCDNIDDPSGITGSINNAVSKNISVIAAAGNNGNYTAISSPACIQNATAIGWSNKDDTINSNSNRNNLTELFAPGTSITSTWLSGSRAESGSSMATPHVSGAFAIIRQYYKLESGKILTPLQILNATNNTGKIIYDSSSQMNFSRIDVFSALLSLDSLSPQISLISPSNNTETSSRNLTFSCNSTDLSMKNITIILRNSTSIYNQTTINSSGSFSEARVNLTDLNFGSYNWSCYSCDLKANCNYFGNYSLMISSISIWLDSPRYTNIGENNFTCNITSAYELKNSTFYLWNSSSLVYNETRNITGLSNSTRFNFTLSIQDNYKWNCLAYSSTENFESENLSLSYDLASPSISLNSPADSYSETSSSATIRFQFNASDNLNLSSCRLIIGDSIQLNQSEITAENNITYTLTPGSYSWNINCTDSAGNTGNSSLRILTISQPVSNSNNNGNSGGSSGGGGGGGGSSAINSFVSLNSGNKTKANASPIKNTSYQSNSNNTGTTKIENKTEEIKNQTEGIESKEKISGFFISEKIKNVVKRKEFILIFALIMIIIGLTAVIKSWKNSKTCRKKA